MIRHCTTLALCLAMILGGTSLAYAHCQVPCGIYNEEARFTAMREDVTTIEKATKLIAELSGKTDAASKQQLVRWTITKEDHASSIISTVAEYFLTQKIKPADSKDKKAYAKYVEQLKACHLVMRTAMGTKQKVDPKAVDSLKLAVEKLAAFYTHTHEK